MSVLYFVIFRTLILKLNLKTPGREDDDEETRLYSKEDYKKKQNQSLPLNKLLKISMN